MDRVPESILPPVKRVRKIRPTPKQIKTLQLINQGYSVSKALREAGYTRSIANKSNVFLKEHRGFSVALESMLSNLEEVGISNKFMASKFKEWLDAKKVDHSHTEPDKEVPDYDTQISAGKLYFDRMDKLQGVVGKGMKRKLTIEEFVTGEENNA